MTPRRRRRRPRSGPLRGGRTTRPPRPAPDAVVIAADRPLARFLPTQLDQLRKSLEAQPVTLQTIPPDLARVWLLPDGRARVQVLPKPEAGNTKGLAEFVA